MAANEDTRHEVVDHNGLPVLLKFLQCATPITRNSQIPKNEQTEGLDTNKNDVCLNPSRPEDFAQISAAERVLQKSAIAISRYYEIILRKFIIFAGEPNHDYNIILLLFMQLDCAMTHFSPKKLLGYRD